MRLTRKQLIVALLAAALAVVAVVYARRWTSQNQAQQQHGPDAKQQAPPAGYADPGACTLCHGQIASTYSLTGMARSFSRQPPNKAWLAEAAGGGGSGLADFKINNRVYHEASERYYTMVERGGKFYQRRHQIGFDGKETNAIEFEANYVIGSGNHARTFLHRKADGRLLEMPVSWYAERLRPERGAGAPPSESERGWGPASTEKSRGYWAMSPGYDRSAHLDFRRLIDAGCMSCHNGYPRGAVEDDGNGPKFAPPSLAGFQPSFGAAGDSLPEGIDCQRCHGPGQAHVDAIRVGDVEAGRRVIVNPGKLDRDRQLETCMQCHLEPTSSPLPFQIRRYEHPPFSYTPGKALGDYFIYFDHAPQSGREDKFEIAGGAYRLRKSACFQRSQMTCLTCHNPHDIPRGAKAVQHYTAVCQSCHEGAHSSGVPPVQGVGARTTCLDCHMPKRRAEDAVHVVMTDHYIQRRRPDGDLLAPRREADNFEHGDYRGEVVAYYPPTLPPTPENELYLALAQVQQGSNLTTGIPRLEEAIKKHRPERADLYYELARAYSKTSDYEADIRWCEEALRRDANFVPALKELAAAATTLGRLAQAAEALEKAVALRPRDGDAFADLGNVYLQQNRVDEAQRALQHALTLDPTMPRANNTMGLAALKKGDTDVAEQHFRAAIRFQPDLAEAQNNLGNLLAGRKAYAEAGYHFEKAIRSNPNYVEARHSYGMVLALTRSYPRAVAELRAAVRLAPRLAQAHTDLADVLAAMGRTDEAAREYESAIQADPAEYDAHLALGEILAGRGRTAEARLHFEAIAQSTDPEMREAALEALRSLGQSR